MEITRTFDLLDRLQKDFNDSDVFVSKVDGRWKHFSTSDYVEYSHRFSLGLLAMGLNKGDRVATVTTNRPEWNFVDMGLAMAGMIHVPVFPTISHREFGHILRHAGGVAADHRRPDADEQAGTCVHLHPAARKNIYV